MPEYWTLISFQSPGAGDVAAPSPLLSPITESSRSDVITTWLPGSPSTSRLPFTKMACCWAILTTVPGSNVSSTPAGMFSCPVTRYGDPCGLHTVSAVRAPLTCVGPGAVTSTTRGAGFTGAGGGTGSDAHAGCAPDPGTGSPGGSNPSPAAATAHAATTRSHRGHPRRPANRTIPRLPRVQAICHSRALERSSHPERKNDLKTKQDL